MAMLTSKEEVAHASVAPFPPCDPFASCSSLAWLESENAEVAIARMDHLDQVRTDRENSVASDRSCIHVVARSYRASCRPDVLAYQAASYVVAVVQCPSCDVEDRHRVDCSSSSSAADAAAVDVGQVSLEAVGHRS